MKILLIAAKKNRKGGVAFYCNTLTKYLKVNHDIIYRGSPDKKENIVSKLLRFISDYLFFLYKLLIVNYDIIHQNTSLARKGVLRDAVYIILSKLLNKKIIVSIHGWNKNYEKWVENHPVSTFRLLYKRVNACIVLASEFKNKLLEWGFKKEIFLEPTIVDENLVSDFNNQHILEKIHKKNKYFTILFLARIEKDKGIIETLKTYQILKEKFNSIQLIIAGEGSCLNKAKDFSIKNNLQDIIFTGYVSGPKKIKIFMESDVYLFPTTYGEGMPISLLEAMAFGLPIITRPMGGIKDFFENERMGFITESKDPKIFAKLTQTFIENKDLTLNISINNYNYAKEHFYASVAIKRLEKIYEGLLNNNH